MLLLLLLLLLEWGAGAGGHQAMRERDVVSNKCKLFQRVKKWVVTVNFTTFVKDLNHSFREFYV